MTDQLLQQPTIPGKVDGFISVDPWQIQCRECGVITTKPDESRIAIWVILARFTFCPVDNVRRCPECRADHRKTCDRCRWAR